MKKYFSAKMVAILLAAIMLVGMLASCDEGDGPTLPQDDPADNQEEAPEENDESENNTVNNTENEKILEVEDFNSKPYDPKLCGNIWPIISKSDYMKIPNGKSSSYEVLKADYEDRLKACSVSNEEFYNCSYDPHLSFAFYKLVGENQVNPNFAMEFKNYQNKWVHSLVSTYDDFALVSTDPNGNIFLTGFVNGKLENDLGFIDKESIKVAKELSAKYSYRDVLNLIRREIFSAFYEDLKDVNSNSMCAANIYDNEMDPSNWVYNVTLVTIYSDLTTPSVTAGFNYEIADNYFDKLFESGSVIDGTIMYDEASRQYYLPGRVFDNDNSDYAGRDPNAEFGGTIYEEGDWNQDGRVDEYDKVYYDKVYGDGTKYPDGKIEGDWNGDGKIDIEDDLLYDYLYGDSDGNHTNENPNNGD